MKKTLWMALVAITTLASCAKQDTEISTGPRLKSLDFTLGITGSQTRMSDGTVDAKVAAIVRANISGIVIEYFNASDATLGTYTFTPEQVNVVISDDQEGTRVPVRLAKIPDATAKVNVYMNVKTATDINDLQTSYNVMEYRGTTLAAITLQPGSVTANGNDLYTVEVGVKPVMSRFEFQGGLADIQINSSTGGTLPTGLTEGTKDEAQKHVNDATIAAAEAAAREAWKGAHSSDPEPSPWVYTYSVKYEYNTAYAVTSIDGYYINNIPLTKSGPLVLNANDGTGNWDAASLTNYTAVTGSMKNMFDTTAPVAGQHIAYNLFPQTFVPAISGAATKDEVRQNMPHFILKLTTNATPATRWITIRAFKEATSNGLITNFEAGKAYILKAAEVAINQYSAKLTVKASGTPGPTIPEDKDPTDPNPEPLGKDLDLLVKILEWNVVQVKPEF